MADLRTAATQALKALEIMQPEVQMGEGDAAITALRAALAEPVQEPYCHVYEYDGVFGLHREFYPREHNGRKPDRAVPLFTAPQRKPVQEPCPHGVTDGACKECYCDTHCTWADHAPGCAWTDADQDAARLALELECLLLNTADTAALSRWWDSAHEALELHRQRLEGVKREQHP